MRLPVLTEDEMTPSQKELSERIIARRGAVRGPYRVWLQSPELCDKVEALGAYARFESSLPSHLAELTLLLAARNWDAQYSWVAHVDKAAESGLPREALDAIARKETPTFPVAADQAFYDFCAELLSTHFVSDETFARAREHFSAQQLVDTIGALGNFTMLGMCLNAFQVDLQPGVSSPFPDVADYRKLDA